MSSLTSLYGGGGGGTPVNSIARLYTGGQTLYTDESGGVWLKTGNNINTDGIEYPDAIQFPDISSSSYTNKSLYISQGFTVGLSGFDFNGDGTKLFAYTRNNKRLWQYSLSTPYDISTGIYDNVSYTFTAEKTGDIGFTFGKNGERLYISDDLDNIIRQYDLSTAYDITTITASGKFISLNDGRDAPRLGLHITPDGTRISFADGFNYIVQYTLSTPFELVSNPPVSITSSNVSGFSSPQSIEFSSDGVYSYVLYQTPGIVEFENSSPYVFTNVNPTGRSYNIPQSGPDSLRFFSDIRKFYFSNFNNFYVYQYEYPVVAGLGTDTGTYDYVKLK